MDRARERDGGVWPRCAIVGSLLVKEVVQTPPSSLRGPLPLSLCTKVSKPAFYFESRLLHASDYMSLTYSCAVRMYFTFSCLSELLCKKSLHSAEHSSGRERAWIQNALSRVGRSIWCLSSSESSRARLCHFLPFPHFPMKSARSLFVPLSSLIPDPIMPLPQPPTCASNCESLLAQSDYAFTLVKLQIALNYRLSG